LTQELALLREKLERATSFASHEPAMKDDRSEP
jgi:hypothetical protein